MNTVGEEKWLVKGAENLLLEEVWGIWYLKSLLVLLAPGRVRKYGHREISG